MKNTSTTTTPKYELALHWVIADLLHETALPTIAHYTVVKMSQKALYAKMIKLNFVWNKKDKTWDKVA